ncbi:MAG: nucleotidyltransferase domain-containing protein [Campylobacterota bacterium]|nr:nucleotidyltransferase domain-containing protein [Campylobacterota bacterium]
MRATKENIVFFLQEIKDKLSTQGISHIALFGSYARGEAGVYSDIDIAIKKDKNYLQTRSAYDYFDQVASIKTLLREKFHKNSDIFDLDSNSSMKQSIIKDLIYV